MDKQPSYNEFVTRIQLNTLLISHLVFNQNIELCVEIFGIMTQFLCNTLV